MTEILRVGDEPHLWKWNIHEDKGDCRVCYMSTRSRCVYCRHSLTGAVWYDHARERHFTLCEVCFCVQEINP